MKLGQFVLRRLKEEGIRAEGIVSASICKAPHHPLNHSIEEVTHAIDRYRNGAMSSPRAWQMPEAPCSTHCVQQRSTTPHIGTTLILWRSRRRAI
ncbi:MAG: hypothetical protein ACLVJ6_06130 [Merdibacter sp.]